MSAHTGVTDIVQEFETFNQARIARSRLTIDELLTTDTPDLAMLAVTTAQLRRLSIAQT